MELTEEQLRALVAEATQTGIQQGLAAARAEMPTVAAPVDQTTVLMHLNSIVELIGNAGTRRTYRTYLLRVMATVPPCHGMSVLTGEATLDLPPVDPAGRLLCKHLGCTLDAGHRALGDLPTSYMTATVIDALVEYVALEAKRKALAKLLREERARRLELDPDADVDGVRVTVDQLHQRVGNNAKETAVTAFRYALKRMPGHGIADVSKVGTKPSRTPTPRRAFTEDELEQVLEVAVSTASDPELTELLLWFHLESGARQNEALLLQSGNIDAEACTVTLGQKNDQQRVQPVSPTLTEALLTFRDSRTHEASGPWVFLNRRGQRASKKVHEDIWSNVRDGLPFAARMQASTHCLRKTTSRLIERSFGVALSEAWLGHRNQGLQLLYPAGTLPEVANVIALLTGQPHPLASDPAQRPSADNVVLLRPT